MERAKNIAKVNLGSLLVRQDINYRDEYDIPSMMEEIRVHGRILEPIHVEKETAVVLKGNRRTKGGQAWLARTDCPADLRLALENTEVIYISKMTEEERDEYVLDQNGVRPLSRVETIKAVFRKMRKGKNETDIALGMYNLLARFTGSTEKATKASSMPLGKDRNTFIQKWLHGTLGNVIMPVGRMGEQVIEQFLLTHLAKDRVLTDEEKAKVKYKLDNARVLLLNSAKSEDSKAGKWDSDKYSGPLFDAKIAEFVKEDRDGKEPGNRFTKTQMTQLGESMQSPLKYAFLKCAGENVPGSVDFDQLDTELQRREKIFSTLTINLERIEGIKVKELIYQILNGSPEQVKVALAEFAGPQTKVA